MKKHLMVLVLGLQACVQDLGPPLDGERIDDGPRGAGATQTYEESADLAATAPQFMIDLDSDGTNETEVRAGCLNPGQVRCLDLVSPAFPKLRSLPLGVAQLGSFELLRVNAIGAHGAGPIAAISVVLKKVGNGEPLIVHVMDPNIGGTVIAGTTGVSGYHPTNVYYGQVRGPGAKQYPFLMAGAGPMDTQSGGPLWSYLCQFDPNQLVSPDPSSAAVCGTGFRISDTLVRAEQVDNSSALWGPYYYRFNGGVLDDLDGDGWDDITYPTSWVLKTLSGRTGEHLVANFFNPSAQTEPNTPMTGFHDGRVYGGLTSFRDDRSGQQRLLVAATHHVGAFKDPSCGVSRYISMFESNPGQPASRRLLWSNYLGFSGSVYVQPPQNYQQVVRMEDRTNKCPHRFGDGLVDFPSVGAAPRQAVAYNFFQANRQTLGLCYKEQYEAAYSGGSLPAYLACVDRTLNARGTWSFVVLDTASGQPVQISPRSYAWGAATGLVPGAGEVVLMEVLPAREIEFDRSNYVTQVIQLTSLRGNGTSKALATCAVSSPPRVRNDLSPISGPAGSSWGGITQLVLADIDGDGYDDFETEDGRWYGWGGEQGCERKG